MIKLFILISSLSLYSCAQLKSPTHREVDNYCQDLNVLYQRKNVINNNIANIETTRTIEGGYYKRKIVQNCQKGICEIVNDETPPLLKYEPKHPDANKNGYVAYPNINLEQEKADQLHWKNVYNIVIANSPVPKGFFFKDKRAATYFQKYPMLKAELDYSEYLGRDTNINE